VPNESGRASLAVLPFANLSDSTQNATFAGAVHEQVLTDLAKIASLKVIGRTSVIQYTAGAPRNLREISQQLGVRYLVEGTVQREAG
jgi:TolB-like protein